MKSFLRIVVALGLTVAALQGRADETNSATAIIGAAQAKAYIGKQVTVTGIVAQVSIRPSLIFLNFEKSYPDNPFTAIVRNSHTNEFEKLPTLKGKPVSVRGQVKDYNGKPEMELTSKSQLKLLSGTNPPAGSP
jgi:DNA/RNA endonuclease YhcR with UshA esterase domain